MRNSLKQKQIQLRRRRRRRGLSLKEHNSGTVGVGDSFAKLLLFYLRASGWSKLQHYYYYWSDFCRFAQKWNRCQTQTTGRNPLRGMSYTTSIWCLQSYFSSSEKNFRAFELVSTWRFFSIPLTLTLFIPIQI